MNEDFISGNQRPQNTTHTHRRAEEGKSDKRAATDFEFVLLAVDDDGGDLLVEEDEDCGQQSGQYSQDGQPPRVN